MLLAPQLIQAAAEGGYARVVAVTGDNKLLWLVVAGDVIASSVAIIGFAIRCGDGGGRACAMDRG
jgi:hypothetical protein